MFSKQNVRRTRILAICGLIVSAMIFGSSVFADNGRIGPGRTQAPSPTPTPATPAPARPATSTPTPQPTRPPGVDRIAPTLGEPPPPPKLKPTPTPTPPEEIDADSRIVINAELVELHVRVIDRNNRPINNVRQNEFRVFEDGVPQTIESFTREEVPISYGLAVDTSGSLRSQIAECHRRWQNHHQQQQTRR